MTMNQCPNCGQPVCSDCGQHHSGQVSAPNPTVKASNIAINALLWQAPMKESIVLISPYGIDTATHAWGWMAWVKTWSTNGTVLDVVAAALSGTSGTAAQSGPPKYKQKLMALWPTVTAMYEDSPFITVGGPSTAESMLSRLKFNLRTSAFMEWLLSRVGSVQ